MFCCSATSDENIPQARVETRRDLKDNSSILVILLLVIQWRSCLPDYADICKISKCNFCPTQKDTSVPTLLLTSMPDTEYMYMRNFPPHAVAGEHSELSGSCSLPQLWPEHDTRTWQTDRPQCQCCSMITGTCCVWNLRCYSVNL